MIKFCFLAVIALAGASTCFGASHQGSKLSGSKEGSPLIQTSVNVADVDPSTTDIRKHHYVMVDTSDLIDKAAHESVAGDIQEDENDRFISTRSGKLRPRYQQGSESENWSEETTNSTARPLSRVKRCGGGGGGGGGGGDDGGDANRARRARRRAARRRAAQKKKANKAKSKKSQSSTTTVTKKVIQNGQVVSETVQPQTTQQQSSIQQPAQQPVVVQQQPAPVVVQSVYPQPIIQKVPQQVIVQPAVQPSQPLPTVVQAQQVPQVQQVQQQPMVAPQVVAPGTQLPTASAQGSVKLSI